MSSYKHLNNLPKKLLIATVLGFAVFCLSGGPLTMAYYLDGYPVTFRTARAIVVSPFYAGFLLLGFMALKHIHSNPKAKAKVLMGFLVLFFSYLSIETFYSLIGGDKIWK